MKEKNTQARDLIALTLLSNAQNHVQQFILAKRLACLLHRENLAAKKIQEDLAIVFNEVVSVVNYIKSRPLCTRLF